MILYRLYQNYGKIDHNLCDYYLLTDGIVYQLDSTHFMEVIDTWGSPLRDGDWGGVGSNIILSGNEVHKISNFYIKMYEEELERMQLTIFDMSSFQTYQHSKKRKWHQKLAHCS